MQRFSDWLKKLLPSDEPSNSDRAKRFGWAMKDVEHHNRDKDTKRFGWGIRDVEHHGVEKDDPKSDLKEEDSWKTKLPPKSSGGGPHIHTPLDPMKTVGPGMLHSLGPKPKYWEKGKISTVQSNDSHPWLPTKAEYDARDKSKPFETHPDQQTLDLTGGKVNPKPTPPAAPPLHLRPLLSRPEDVHTHADLREHFEDHYKKIKGIFRINQYIGRYKEDSSQMNEHLRDRQGRGVLSEWKPDVSHMDMATSFPTTKPMVLYRGMHDERFRDLPIGHQFTDHGFTSTSRLLNTATFFSRSGKHDVFRIHTHPGVRAHYLDFNDHEHVNGNEGEVLLHRGTRFKILNHHYLHSHDQHVTDLGIVRQRTPKDTLW